jgi:hypothetical protein
MNISFTCVRYAAEAFFGIRANAAGPPRAMERWTRGADQVRIACPLKGLAVFLEDASSWPLPL